MTWRHVRSSLIGCEPFSRSLAASWRELRCGRGGAVLVSGWMDSDKTAVM